MIWNILIIVAVVIIFIILARRLPLASKIKDKEEPELSEKEMTTFGIIAQADDAFDRKEYSEAENLYVKAAAQDPDNSKIYNRLGAIYLEQKNFYDSKEAFLQALKLEPDNASRYINLGLAYLGLKDYFKATSSFEKALEINPENKKYQNLLEKARKSQDKEKKKIK